MSKFYQTGGNEPLTRIVDRLADIADQNQALQDNRKDKFTGDKARLAACEIGNPDRAQQILDGNKAITRFAVGTGFAACKPDADLFHCEARALVSKTCPAQLLPILEKTYGALHDQAVCVWGNRDGFSEPLDTGFGDRLKSPIVTKDEAAKWKVAECR